jgi:hypothetical protein
LADNIRRVLRGTKLSLFIEDLEMLLSWKIRPVTFPTGTLLPVGKVIDQLF